MAAPVRSAIITCAPTGAIHTPTMSDALPITPEEIAHAAIAAGEAGAAICHLHVRDPKDGHPVQDPGLFTLPRGLADLVSGSLGSGTQYPLKLGAALLATIPVAIIFTIFQRYFVRDANEGSERG